MKRTVIMAVGAVALSVAIHVSTSVAQPTRSGSTTTPASSAVAQPKTRVALINLTYVIKNYKKFTQYQEELKSAVQPFQARDTALKADAEKLAKEAQNSATTSQRREAIEKDLKDLQRKIEDNKNDAQKILIKKQEEQVKTLYMDVRKVVERYAQAHGYEMVLHYNDAVTTEEYWSAQNIARKMQAGALVPMYMAGGLDISANIVQTLNAGYGNAAATPTGTRTGGR